MDYKNITIKDIEETVNAFFKNNPNTKKSDIFMKNTKWIDEDGNKCSSWNIGGQLITEDGGAELFRKAMKDNLKTIKKW